MPKTQIIYNQIGAYSTNALSNSYHFISENGNLNSDWAATGNYSLIFPLNRVTSAAFSFEPNRTNISHLGDLGTIARPVLDNTEINLSINYYLQGLINDVRIGLYCNIPSGDSFTGPMLFGTGKKSPIYGYYSRDTARSSESELAFPFIQREPRNLFFGIQKDTFDFNRTNSGTTLSTSYRNTDVDCLAFGDCFLTSYSCSAGVGQLPNVSAGFVCNNVEMYSSGTDCIIPSINTRTYNINSGYKFSLPNNFQGTGLPTVLLPQDITLSIKQRSNNSENLTDLFLDYTDIKIQNFDFNFTLNRTPLYSIGAKFPLDKPIQFPVICDLNFNFLPGDNKASSLVSLIKRDENYDVTIKLNYQRGALFNGTAVQYEFLGAKFKGFDNNISISERQNNSLSFTTELDPLNTTRGLFITGYLGIPNYPTDISYLLGDFNFDGTADDNLLFQTLDLFALSIGGFRLLY
jgi:hypothetical protein